MVNNLQIEPVFCHLTGDYLILIISTEQRQDGGRYFHVVDAAVPVGEQGPGNWSVSVVHGTDHITAAFVRKPGVDVLCQQLRLLGRHHIVIPGRYPKSGGNLPVEQLGRPKDLLLARQHMVNLKSLPIFPQMEGFCLTDKIPFGLTLSVKLYHNFLQTSSCFHPIYPPFVVWEPDYSSRLTI